MPHEVTIEFIPARQGHSPFPLSDSLFIYMALFYRGLIYKMSREIRVKSYQTSHL